MKKALKMFALSRDHTGLLQSRYPSAEKQYIPGFSLFWIGMLHDYMMWRGDVELLTQMTPAMLSILEYFNSQMDKNTGPLREIFLRYGNFLKKVRDAASAVYRKDMKKEMKKLF